MDSKNIKMGIIGKEYKNDLNNKIDMKFHFREFCNRIRNSI